MRGYRSQKTIVALAMLHASVFFAACTSKNSLSRGLQNEEKGIGTPPPAEKGPNAAAADPSAVPKISAQNPLTPVDPSPSKDNSSHELKESGGNSVVVAPTPTPTATPPLIPPDEVANLVALPQSTSAAWISWDQSSHASGYVLVYKAGSVPPADCTANEGTVVPVVAAAGHAIGLTLLSASTQYSLRVCAFSTDVSPTATSGTASSFSTLSPLPNEITGLTNSQSLTTSIALSWDSATNAESYRVSYAEGSSIPASCASSLTPAPRVTVTPSYTFTGLNSGTQYSFRVCSLNGNPLPDISGGVTIQSYTRPSAPTAVSSSASDGAVSVSFSSPTGASSYRVYYSSSSPVTSAASYVSGASSPISVGSLANGTQFYFKMAAINSAGESTLSSEVSATPLPPMPTAPILEEVIGKDLRIRVHFSTVSGASSYRVYYKTTPGVQTSDPYFTTTTPSTFHHTGLVNGVKYYYRVTALNLAGEGPLSIERSTSATMVRQIIADEEGVTGISPKGAKRMAFLNSNLFVATPTGIFKSSDKGGNWTPVTASRVGFVSDNCTDLAAFSGDLYAYCGNLYKSSDGGINWNVIPGLSALYDAATLLQISLYEPQLFIEENAMIFNVFGSYLISTDGGQTFAGNSHCGVDYACSNPVSRGTNRYAIANDNNTNANFLMKSSDAFATETLVELTTGSTNWLTASKIATGGNRIVIGFDSAIAVSGINNEIFTIHNHDAMDTSSTPEGPFLDIKVNENDIFVVGGDSGGWVSHDWGASWSRFLGITANAYSFAVNDTNHSEVAVSQTDRFSFASPGGNTFPAAFNPQTIYETLSDGTNLYANLAPPFFFPTLHEYYKYPANYVLSKFDSTFHTASTFYDFSADSFLPNSVATKGASIFFGTRGVSPYFKRSTDSGATFTTIGSVGSSVWTVDAHASTIVVSAAAGFYTSTDDGANFVSHSVGNDSFGFPCGVYNTAQFNGKNYAAANTCGMFFSSDWDTWSTPATVPSGWTKGFYSTGTTLFAAGTYGLWKTTDGTNFSNVASFPAGAQCERIFGEGSTIVVKSSFGIVISKDAGVTWTTVPLYSNNAELVGGHLYIAAQELYTVD